MQLTNTHSSEVEPLWPIELSSAEIDVLVAIASDTVVWCADGYKGKFDFGHYADSAHLATPRATFVTLRRFGALRGCMGTIEPVSTLRVSVHQNAANAATRDPRFKPVAHKELDDIDISISMLGPLRRIADLDEFEVGKHGLLLKTDAYRGVFLPEVALEQGWDREETFNALCQKAGAPEPLDPDACTLSVFESLSIVGLHDPGEASEEQDNLPD